MDTNLPPEIVEMCGKWNGKVGNVTSGIMIERTGLWWHTVLNYTSLADEPRKASE